MNGVRSARQMFALDLEGAWDLISTFRDEWALMSVEFPPCTVSTS